MTARAILPTVTRDDLVGMVTCSACANLVRRVCSAAVDLVPPAHPRYMPVLDVFRRCERFRTAGDQ